MSCCLSPLSPIACRAALIRVLNAESEMTRFAPYGCEKHLLADNVIAIFDQVQDQIEHLRLDAYNVPRASQLAAVNIHDAITKQQAHRRHSEGRGSEPETGRILDGKVSHS